MKVLMQRLTLLLSMLACVTLLAACGDSEEEAAAAEGPVSYEIGTPIQDSTYALIVSSDFGSDTLTTPEFRQQMSMIQQRMPQAAGMSPQQRRQMRQRIAEEFVMRHLLSGEAEERGVQADTAQVAAQMQRFRSQFENEQQFQQALQADNMTEDSLRAMVEEQSRLRALQQQMAEAAAEPTAAELDSFRQQRAEQIQAQHILLRVNQNAPAETADSVQALAQALIDSAQAGTEFAALARRHSQGPSASRGGQLDYFSRGQMVPPFEEAAFALQDSGDVASEPVRTRFGYHVIRLTGQRTGELMDTTQARQTIMQERQRAAVENEMNRLRRQVTVRLNQDVVDADLNANSTPSPS